MVRTVGILIFDDVEVLDFCGPFEVFSVARQPDEGSDGTPLFKAVTIAEKPGVVTCNGGLLVQPHLTVDDDVRLDILVVPGGQGTRREVFNTRLLGWIVERNKTAELTASICTGAFLLAEAHLLDGRRATTHWASVDRMRAIYPGLTVLSSERVVDEGHVITSAGVSAGIDMALHVVGRLHGHETAAWTARRMEYDWRE